MADAATAFRGMSAVTTLASTKPSSGRLHERISRVLHQPRPAADGAACVAAWSLSLARSESSTESMISRWLRK